MSATRKYLFPSALMLVLILTVTASASGQGIWSYLYRTDGVYGHKADNVTLSIVNLTTHRLVVKSPNPGTIWDTYCMDALTVSVCHTWESYPFQESSSTLKSDPNWQAANNVLYIYPYRSATWGSTVTGASAGGYAWEGTIVIYPEGSIGSISGESLMFAVGAAQQNPDPGANPIINRNGGKGTWWGLYGGATSLWSPVVSNYFQGIYLTPYVVTSQYNAMTKMTANGELTVSLFAGANNHPVLVVRENQGLSYLGWKLDFVDQPSDSMPQN